MTMMAEKATDETVLTEETPLEQKASRSILDGGAVSFLVGKSVLDTNLEQIKKLGRNEKVRVLQCEKHFRCRQRPDRRRLQVRHLRRQASQAFGGKSSYVEVYTIAGGTPFLSPRPLMEDLRLSIDYGEKAIRWHIGEWFKALQGRQGHYRTSVHFLKFIN